MGRLIDTSELAKHIELQKKRFGNLLEVPICNVFADMIRDTPPVEAITKADYEARLRADMVAMLTEIQLEIEEKEYLDVEEPINITQDYIDELKSWEYGKKDCCKIVQQKINALKGAN